MKNIFWPKLVAAGRAPRFKVSDPSRRFETFTEGQTILHRGSRTLGVEQARMMAEWGRVHHPLYVNAFYAKECGFKHSPIFPVVLFNLALSLTVEDLSMNTISIAYPEVLFLKRAMPESTFAAMTTVTKKEDKGAKGIITFDIVLYDMKTESPVMLLRRKSLFDHPGRKVDLAIQPYPSDAVPSFRIPGVEELLASGLQCEVPTMSGVKFTGPYYEDYEVGDVTAVRPGKTIGESEHMMLTEMFGGIHPGHTDQVWCDAVGGGFIQNVSAFNFRRVVYGGIYFAISMGIFLQENDRVYHTLRYHQGALSNPVYAVDRDTVSVISRVEEKREIPGGRDIGLVTFRHVVLKNALVTDFDAENQSVTLLLDLLPGEVKSSQSGLGVAERKIPLAWIFTPERSKKHGLEKLTFKVLEISEDAVVLKNPDKEEK